MLAETAQICACCSVDPLGLIGSGALLVTVPAPAAPALLRTWTRQGITGSEMGSVESGRGVRATRAGRPVPFPWKVKDEIIEALSRPA